MTKSSVDAFFKAFERYPMLEANKTIELARTVREWQDHPDGPDACPAPIRRAGLAARDRMVRHNLRLIVHFWRRQFSSRIHHTNAGLADALQTASICLIRAAEKYDPSTGRTFATYAANWISKGFNDYLGKEERMIRIPHNNRCLIFAGWKYINDTQRDKGYRPSWEEVTAHLKSTRSNIPCAKTVQELCENYSKTLVGTMDAGTDEEKGRWDRVADPNTEESEPTEAQIQAKKLELAMGHLSDQERTLIKLRFASKGKPVGVKKTAKEVGCQPEQVPGLADRALGRLRELCATSRVD